MNLLIKYDKSAWNTYIYDHFYLKQQDTSAAVPIQKSPIDILFKSLVAHASLDFHVGFYEYHNNNIKFMFRHV